VLDLEGLAVDGCCPHDEISSNRGRTLRCLFIAQSRSFRLGRHREKTVRVQLSTKSRCLAKSDTGRYSFIKTTMLMQE
jgi:hypothetical protein